MNRALIALSVALIALTAAGVARAAAPFTFQTAFGTTGMGTLNGPFGLALSRDGSNVYVADHGSKRILQFTRDGTFVRAWGGDGSGPGQFKIPDGVATDPAGNVYVADCTNNRVSKFTASGTFIRSFGRNGGDGSAGSGNGEFSCTVTVAIDPAGHIVAGDSGNHRVQVLSQTGALLLKIGSNGHGNGQFDDPEGLTVDPAGNVYVVDNSDGRVQEFSPTGAFIRKWGGTGTADGQFVDAETLTVDPFGSVWVSDDSAHRIDQFSAAGTFLAKFGKNGGDGTSGNGNGEFAEPEQVGFDCRGNAYVADFDNNRVQAFGFPGLPDPQCHTPGTATGSASAGVSTATLSGLVADDSQVAGYHFEFGRTTAYGSSTAPQLLPASASTATVRSVASGLAPSTTYHYRLVAANYTGATTGADHSFTTAAAPSAEAVRAAIVSRATQSARRWREGDRLARATRKRRIPVGTTFRYSLDKPAAVRFTFRKLKPGRRVRHRCVAPTRHNRHKHRCTRARRAGTLTFAGHAGRNKVRFEGRLSRRRRLKPGRYTLVIKATTPGAGSTSAKLRFRIVK